MCPPVLDGQPISAAITNPSFIDAVVDDSAAGIISFENTDPASGAFVDNIQKESNSAASFMGKALNSSATDLPVYTNNEVGAANDPLFDRVDVLSGKFNASGGHAHTGAAGDAPAIAASDLASVPLRGFVRQGNNVTTGTGSSVVVTSDFSSQTPGGSALQTGVVTDPTFNKVLLRQTAGSESGDIFTDADGNEVYGRLTYAALNWTLSFYVDLSGTETAYSFPSSQVAAIYYQEIFNPMVNPPTYSEFAIIPSDNVTADVVTATTTVQGKVSLASTSQPVGSSSGGGTANASVANADHTHAGVHSVAKSGSTGLLGDVTLSGSGGTTLTQASQNIDIASVALTTATTPSNVASTAAIGSSTESAKADHAHAGVYAVDAGFGNKLGTVAVTSSGGTTLSNTAGGFQIASPSLTASSPAEVAGTAAVGVATDIARSDHAHRGVHSVSKSGSSQLFGDVTLSAGTNITLTQTGQNIEVASTASSGGVSSLPITFIDKWGAPFGLSYSAADYLDRGTQFRFRPYLTSTDAQHVIATFLVPSGYVPGSNITLKLMFAVQSNNTMGFSVDVGYIEQNVSGNDYDGPNFTDQATVSFTKVCPQVDSIYLCQAVIAPLGVVGVTSVQPGNMMVLALRTNSNHTIAGFTYLYSSVSEVNFT